MSSFARPPLNKTKKSAVIGNPISQSLSPFLHNYLLKKYKINGSYIAVKVLEGELQSFLNNMPKIGFSGCNVTIPHKENALKFCHHLSKTAQAIGAVNTIIITKDGKLFGHNSDGYGFIENIKTTHLDFKFKNKTVLVLGAGGAARAIIFELLKHKVSKVIIANRNLEKSRKIIDDFGHDYLQSINWKNRNKNLKDIDILINATALGMVGKDDLEIDLTCLPKTSLVCDIVYKPLMTKLLTSAQNRGNPIATGIGMLLYQGLIGFEGWFGTKPQIDQDLIDQTLELSKL